MKQNAPTTAEEAAAFLRENAPRNPAEQAALDAMGTKRWVLWHAHDANLAVVLMLSRFGLLRDKAAEQRQERTARVDAQLRERDRLADQVALSRLGELVEQAATRLAAGDNPAEVADWMRRIQESITETRDRARR